MKQLIVIRTDAQGQNIDPNKAPSELQRVAEYLVNKENLKVREGVFHGNRIEYFKGKKAIDALLKEKFRNSVKRPEITDRDEASKVVQQLMEQHNFFFRVEKEEHRQLDVDSKQYFEEDGYYVWQWESPWARMKSMIFSFLLLAIVLVGVMFPLWPSSLRLGVWYLSMGGVGLIGALLVLAVIRLIFFAISLVLPFTRPGVWLFPNLFADVGVIDSFIPLWGWHGIDYESVHRAKYQRQKEKSKKKSKKDKKGKAPASSQEDDDDDEPDAPNSAEEEWEDEVDEELVADEKPINTKED